MNQWMKWYCLPMLLAIPLAGVVPPAAGGQPHPIQVIEIDPSDPVVGQAVTVRLRLLFYCQTSPALNPQGQGHDFNVVEGELIMDVAQRWPEVIIHCLPPTEHEYEVQFPAPGSGSYPLTVYRVPEDTLFPIQPEDRPDSFHETEIVFGAPQAVSIPTLGLAGLLGLALFTLLFAGWGFRQKVYKR